MTAWNVVSIDLADDVIQYQIEANGKLITVSEWIQLLKTSPEFVLFFNSILAESPFQALYWETKPMTKLTLQQKFEFVLVGSKSLRTITPNETSFSQFFTEENVVHFPNLKKDAHLVVPTPKSEAKNYTHLANFCRYAPQVQQINFWQMVATIYESKISDSPVWLSTAGLGVSWLHVRIDSRPKYYKYQPYKLI